MTKKKRRVGRPSKYDPKYCKELIDFFNVEYEREIEIPHYKKGELAWTDVKEVANNPPFIEAFARQIGVAPFTIYKWRDTHPEFSNAFACALQMRMEMIVSLGLRGLYNSAFAIFTMKNMYKWIDKQEVDHGGKISFEEFINEAVSRARRYKAPESIYN